MTEGQGTAADRGRPSFLVGVEVISKRGSAVWTRTRWASSRKWEAMAGWSSREDVPRLHQTDSTATASTCTHIPLSCQETSSSDFPLPEPCENDILVVCQHPHALSRNRLVPALAGRTIAA